MKAIKYIVIAFLLSVMPMVGITQVAITESGNSSTSHSVINSKVFTLIVLLLAKSSMMAKL